MRWPKLRVVSNVAVFEAAVAEGDAHVRFGHDPAVEIGDALVGELRHEALHERPTLAC
jgi:hypothetical protein